MAFCKGYSASSDLSDCFHSSNPPEPHFLVYDHGWNAGICELVVVGKYALKRRDVQRVNERANPETSFNNFSRQRPFVGCLTF